MFNLFVNKGLNQLMLRSGTFLTIFFLFFPPSFSRGEALEEKGDISINIAKSEIDATVSENAISPFELAIQDGNLDSFIADQGIERSDRAVSYLLFKAEKALRQDQGAEAIRLGEMAKKISPGSPLPFFFLVKAYWHVNPINISDTISHYFSGLSLVLKDFFLLISISSPFLLLFLMAILLSFLTFMIYSLVSYASIWIHQFSEFSNGYLHPISSGFLFSTLFFIPLILGVPIFWLILFSFLLFWRFYNPNEKGMIITFLIGLGCAAWILPAVLTLFTARGSVHFDEMSRNFNADYLWTAPQIKTKPSNWEESFLLASFEGRQGRYEKAQRLYQNALDQNPNSPMILNNLGNISFYLKDYDQAIDYYKEAIKLSPKLMSAHFNLSQAYREKLLFDEGDRIYSAANAMNPKIIERYSMKSARFPKFPIIEAHFATHDLQKRFLMEIEKMVYFSEQIWTHMLGPIPMKMAPLIAGICIILLTLSSSLTDMFLSARPCAFCKQAICRKCAMRLFSYQACEKCQMLYKAIQKKSDFSIIEDAVKKVPMKLYPFFLLPGGGHLAAGRTKLAFFFLTLFYLLIGSIWMQESLIPATEWYLHRSGSLLQLVLLLILYVAVGVDLFRTRKIRLWL